MRPRVETEDRKDGGTDTQGKVIPSPQGHPPPYQNQKQTQCGAGKKKKKNPNSFLIISKKTKFFLAA